MKTRTIDAIRKKHKKEIEEFQKKCNHPDISDFIDEWWALGHSTGRQVKVCRRCDKIVQKAPEDF